MGLENNRDCSGWWRRGLIREKLLLLAAMSPSDRDEKEEEIHGGNVMMKPFPLLLDMNF